MRTTRKKSSCHPEALHYAKGLCAKCYVKQYVKVNKSKYRVSSRVYYQKNKAVILWKTYKRRILDSARSRAKEKNLPFSLVLEDIKIPKFCPIFGIKLERPFKGRTGNAPSLDRIDNTKGYTKDNIIIVSNRANRLKSDSTINELKQLSDFYLSLQHTLADGTSPL